VRLLPASAGMLTGDLPQTSSETLFLAARRPFGFRCVERCWPTTRHARRSETPKRSRRATTALRRRSGVRISPSTNSLSMSMSNACSATSFFNRWFSPSSCFSRLASSAFIPPYCAPPVERRLRHFHLAQHLHEVLPLVQKAFALPDLPHSLLRRVSASLHDRVHPSIPPRKTRPRLQTGSLHGDSVISAPPSHPERASADSRSRRLLQASSGEPPAMRQPPARVPLNHREPQKTSANPHRSAAVPGDVCCPGRPGNTRPRYSLPPSPDQG
jgi:hypothetical protein